MFRLVRPIVTIITAQSGSGLSLFLSGKWRRMPPLGSGENPAGLRFVGFSQFLRWPEIDAFCALFWDEHQRFCAFVRH